jgi:5S rRNA maturation endonuclease (ribonuclease M5)
MVTAKEVADVLEKSKPMGAGKFQACCPAHEDKTPSLTITDAPDKLLWKCHAGCSQEDVAAAIERKGINLRPAIKPQTLNLKPKQSKTYDYKDDTGAVRYRVIRKYKNGEKTFLQQKKDGEKFVYSMEGVERLPYNLPGILGAEKVVVVEGEKDVDNLKAIGVAATCNSGGAVKWQPELNQWIEGKQVYIVPDNDEPGHKHADDVTKKLTGIAGSIKTVDLCQGMPDKADVSDWLQMHKPSAEAFWSALEGHEQPLRANKLKSYSIEELVNIPRKEALIKRWLDRSAMSVVYGNSGSGKTFLAIDMCFHIAMGREWSGNRVHQGTVVYIAAEGGGGIRKRFEALLKYYYLESKDVPLRVIPAPVDLCSTDADTDALILECQEHNAEIIVVDTLSRALAGGDENGPKDMGAFVVHCDHLRQAVDAHVMVIHHSGKDIAKGARGHTSLRAATDTEIELVKDDFTGTVTATSKKQRDQEEGQTFSYVLHSVGIDTDQDGDVIDSCVVEPVEGEVKLKVKLSPAQYNAKKAMLNHLAGSDQKGLTLPEWRQLMIDKGVTDKRTRAYTIKDQLDAKGVIRIENQVIYPVIEGVTN